MTAVTFSLSVQLQLTSRLKDWNPHYPLILGNEHSGDRPWKGTIYSLRMADRTLSAHDIQRIEKGEQTGNPSSIIASYQFQKAAPFSDEAGCLPSLSWKGNPSSAKSSGASLGPRHWLETFGPASCLNERIKKASQFTLLLTLVSHESHQQGPARIVSLSKDPWQRNFTLAQDGGDLVFRLRNPVTGENGVKPEARVPGVFAHTLLQRIAVSYDGSVLDFYTDGVHRPHSFRFTPGVVLAQNFVDLSSLSRWINIRNLMNACTFLYYTAVFVPMGISLADTVRSLRISSFWQVVITGVGLACFSIVLDVLLSRTTGRRLRMEYVLLGSVCGAMPCLLRRAHYRTTLARCRMEENSSI